MKRRWFEDSDGTYYRNCPLILGERKRAARWCRFILARKLESEWHEVFRQGVTRKAELNRGDVAVRRTTFREAYPDRSEMWILDDDGGLL